MAMPYFTDRTQNDEGMTNFRAIQTTNSTFILEHVCRTTFANTYRHNRMMFSCGFHVCADQQRWPSPGKSTRERSIQLDWIHGVNWPDMLDDVGFTLLGASTAFLHNPTYRRQTTRKEILYSKNVTVSQLNFCTSHVFRGIAILAVRNRKVKTRRHSGEGSRIRSRSKLGTPIPQANDKRSLSADTARYYDHFMVALTAQKRNTHTKKETNNTV